MHTYKTTAVNNEVKHYLSEVRSKAKRVFLMLQEGRMSLGEYECLLDELIAVHQEISEALSSAKECGEETSSAIHRTY